MANPQVAEAVSSQELESPRRWRVNPGSSVRLPLGERLRWFLGLWGAGLIYAIVRYNVFKGVEWIHLPSYIVNKSFALAAVGFVTCSYLTGKWIKAYPTDPQRRRALAKFLGLTGFYFAGVHMILSLVMLSPAYYEKFFLEAGKMNLTGELTFLCGALALGFLAFPAITTLPYMYEALGGERWQRAQRMGYWALGAAAGHTFFMGWQGWLDVSTWPGGLPPITMIGCLLALSALLAKGLSILKRKQTAALR